MDSRADADVSRTVASFAAMSIVVMVTSCTDGVPRPERPTIKLPNGVSIIYALPKQISLHAPVPLSITVTNGTAETVHIELGMNGHGNSQMFLTLPNGTRLSIDSTRPPPGVVDFAYWPGGFDLPPGERRSAEAVLNEWVDFSAVGTYRLDIRFRGAVQGPNYTPIAVQRTPAPLTVQVRPRDTRELEELATDLIWDIQGPYAEPALRAMKKLEHLEDAISVPYWSRIITERKGLYTAQKVVRALEQIATPEARAALESATRSDDPWTAFYAGAALGRLDRRPKP